MNSECPFVTWLEDYIHNEFKNLSNSIDKAITQNKDQFASSNRVIDYKPLLDMIDKTILHELEDLYDVIYDSILRCLPYDELP